MHLRLSTLGSRIYTCFELEAKMGNVRSLSGFVMLLSAFVPLSAQWPSYPTPGIPRTPDGKPNLTAPAPKMPDGKPDLSGLWDADRRFLVNIAVDLAANKIDVPMRPAGLEL